jgi:hypothetical protein
MPQARRAVVDGPVGHPLRGVRGSAPAELIVLIDFDTRPRRRSLVVQLSGARDRAAGEAGEH